MCVKNSVHGGGVVSQHALQVVSQHALQQVCVLSQYALQQGRSAPGGCLVWGVCSWGGAWSRGSAPGGICSQGGGVPGGDPPRQLLLHAVRILLECILVKNIFLSSLPLLQPKINLKQDSIPVECVHLCYTHPDIPTPWTYPPPDIPISTGHTHPTP